MEKKKILIIEDDLDMIEAVKIMLEPLKECTITTAADPEEGFQKAKEERPDLIMLDVMFGSKQTSDGFELAVKFKKDGELARVPILMITAINREYPKFGFFTGSDGEYLPVDDFMDKPVQPEDVQKKVKALLEQKVSKWADWPDKTE